MSGFPETHRRVWVALAIPNDDLRRIPIHNSVRVEARPINRIFHSGGFLGGHTRTW